MRPPVGIASTTQAYAYANFAVSVSTVAVLTGGAVVRRPSSLPHHLFKSSKQKPGERATWLVKYACVGPLQWNNDCGITPACARGCVAISCQHWVNVRDVYSWGRGRERDREIDRECVRERERKRRKRGVIKVGGEVGDTDITPVWAVCVCICWDCRAAEGGSAGWKTEEVCRSKKRIILLYVIQMEKHFFQKEVKRFIDCWKHNTSALCSFLFIALIEAPKA